MKPLTPRDRHELAELERFLRSRRPDRPDRPEEPPRRRRGHRPRNVRIWGFDTRVTFWQNTLAIVVTLFGVYNIANGFGCLLFFDEVLGDTPVYARDAAVVFLLLQGMFGVVVCCIAEIFKAIVRRGADR